MPQAEPVTITTLSASNDGAVIAARRSLSVAAIAANVEELIRIRDEAANSAAYLIALLDDQLPDVDLEDNGDEEPTLGWTGAEAAYGRHQQAFEGEAEPSLGWTATGNQTARQWRGDVSDLEGEHDGREPDVDDEEGHDTEDCVVAIRQVRQ